MGIGSSSHAVLVSQWPPGLLVSWTLPFFPSGSLWPPWSSRLLVSMYDTATSCFFLSDYSFTVSLESLFYLSPNFGSITKLRFPAQTPGTHHKACQTSCQTGPGCPVASSVHTNIISQWHEEHSKGHVPIGLRVLGSAGGKQDWITRPVALIPSPRKVKLEFYFSE